MVKPPKKLNSIKCLVNLQNEEMFFCSSDGHKLGRLIWKIPRFRISAVFSNLLEGFKFFIPYQKWNYQNFTKHFSPF
jgi:hypothetical protein